MVDFDLGHSILFMPKRLIQKDETISRCKSILCKAGGYYWVIWVKCVEIPEIMQSLVETGFVEIHFIHYISGRLM